MDTRSGSQCSVTPEAILNNEKLVLPPRISRVNGWSLPLHYFQVVTWAVFVGLSSATFGIFIPFLPHAWKYIAYVVTGGIFSFHLVVHLIASCIDPADSNVRLMKNYSQPMPLFDRSKHAHVIQNQFCHLCKVTVPQHPPPASHSLLDALSPGRTGLVPPRHLASSDGPLALPQPAHLGPDRRSPIHPSRNKKTKHCISCNKCVSGFDHHCKWINNCVGSRNYWFFFSTVASATAGMLCLIAILLYVLVQYLVNPGVLRTDPRYEDVKNMNTWLLFLPLFPVQVQTLIVVIIGMLVLLLDFLGLVHLGQLLIFHIYLRSASPRSEIMDKKGKSQEEIKSMRTQQAQQEAELTPRPAGVVPEAKKMTTFEYLINNRKEESSKHQAVRKDPYVQMDKGVLQQGAGALGSSAQGVKAKSSLLIHKHLCHFCTSVNQDGDSTARSQGQELPADLQAPVSVLHSCTPRRGLDGTGSR
ncbi:palmitoyltransferase ZDHHC11 isoform X2 [Homo sapiens]|uniref:palmitoyltransferase ZDHHC11 isoform X2 n=1 Tax=Homo sapiens TaxID=9606 RepID=UPI0005D0073F|nr:palmitoyltransferase ZDHHC11 isoform X2 [Homo sapiens]XP_054209478.1 palmitoyltransferase ZDHHC11 isoform X2 [Homo sapiens]